MIRLDLTGHAVTVEGDGNVNHFICVRSLQTAGSASRVARYIDEWIGTSGDEAARSRNGRQDEIVETVRSRSASGDVLREYDIDEPGVYSLTSGRRELQQNRTFYIRVEFTNDEMTVTILPGSAAPCQWIVEDDLHNYVRDETYGFSVRFRLQDAPQGDGQVTRIESDKTGVKFERTTAWERLLEDDNPDSV